MILWIYLLPASLRGRVVLRKGNKMKYSVQIGISKEIKLVTERDGVIDLIITCLDNGYRVTVIPVAEDVEEIIKGEFEELEKEEAQKLGMGKRIADRLAAIGMSQRELAKDVKITEVSLSRYINGERTPKGPIISSIARALGVSCDWLLGMD